MEPISEHKRINQLLRNEFVSQFITVFNWTRVKTKLTFARLTWPTETSQPTIFRSKPQTKETNIGTQAHKPVTSKRICLKTDLSCQTSMYPGEPQCCQSNLANREHPTNKFSLEDCKEALSKYMHIHHYRKTYWKTSNSKWNCPATDPSCQWIISPGEAQYCQTNAARRKQPTISRWKTQTKKPLTEQEHTPVTSKRVSRNGSQLSNEQASKRG